MRTTAAMQTAEHRRRVVTPMYCYYCFFSFGRLIFTKPSTKTLVRFETRAERALVIRAADVPQSVTRMYSSALPRVYHSFMAHFRRFRIVFIRRIHYCPNGKHESLMFVRNISAAYIFDCSNTNYVLCPRGSRSKS